MGGLTRVPLQLIEPGSGQANDVVLFNGSRLELQDPDDNNADTQLVSGDYDVETGTLSLMKADRSTVLIRGLLTKGSIGVGPTGPTGPQGKPGVNGRNGKDGRRGDTGCVGPKGDPGPAGNTGPAGQAGGPGTLGATGPTGPTGGKGEAGRDGKSPTFGVSETGGHELFDGATLKCWGRLTTTSESLFQRIVFSEAFTVDTTRTAFLQFVDPASPIKNAVRIDKVNRGNMELSIDQSLLPQVPDGAGGTKAAKATGWDLYWFVVGADAGA